MFNRSGSPSNPLSFEPSLNPNSKKRRRQPSECNENPSDNKPRVPRRIDPDRLAIRLGPDLVSEMDAYIVPGAKMPSFQVRQQFVKKYSVDRRHIYDYFHSRGLRVAKEDKHLNLSNRMRKPAASRKPPAPRATPSDDSNLVESATIVDSFPLADFAMSDVPVDSAMSDAPSQTTSVPPPTSLVKSTKGSSKRILAGSSLPAPALQASVSPLLPSQQSIDLSSDSSGSEEGDSSMFDVTNTLTDSSSFDLSLLALGCSVSDDKLRESFGPDFIPFPPALTEDPLFGLDEFQRDIPQISSQPFSLRDSLLPLDDLSRLSENDRIEFYDLVDAGIGPAQGIEECVGTYKSHMERLYSNRSYTGAQSPSRYHHDGSSYPHPKTVVNTRPPTIVEKENINPRWSAPRDPQPPNNNYYRQTAVPSSPLRLRNSHHVPLSPRREQPFTSYLLAKPIRPAKSFISPSVTNPDKRISTRNPIPHELPTPLVWTSPITSAPSQPRPQKWEAARTNPFAIPTYYSSSGDRIVYQAKSILT
ncbi:hypothetical protein DFH06DRAFT_1470633 [Mycena polygramma]|nr:hypothetical protein DFH06DRAFT_1470633 [Mycena polygramma]